MSQVLQVKAEFLVKRVRSFAHLNSLDLSRRLRARRELESLQLTEHLHVALEFKLGRLNDLLDRLSDLLCLESHADFAVFFLQRLALLRVLHVLLHCQLVVLGIELNPLAGLLRHTNDRLLELSLAFTEHFYVLLLVLLSECFHLACSESVLLGQEGPHGLPCNNSSQNHVVVVLKSAVKVSLELTMLVQCVAHCQLRVLVLICRLWSAKQVAQHSVCQQVSNFRLED